MTETNGSGWFYQCWSCGYKVTIDAGIPKECPGCGVGGWWGHLTPQDDSRPQNLRDKTSEPIKSQADNLSQVSVISRGFSGPGNGQNKPGPKPLPLEDIVRDLASQGLSSRAIAAKLTEQGINVSYKTVQRRLQGSLL